MEKKKKKLPGFAGMTLEERLHWNRLGGQRVQKLGTGHTFTADEARSAGRKGGLAVAKDRKYMAEIGRRGGLAVAAKRGYMADLGRRGGQAKAKSLAVK